MIIKYDPRMDQWSRPISRSNKAYEFYARYHPERYVIEILKYIRANRELLHLKENEMGQFLSYVLMPGRQFPVHDISLLAANMIRRKIEKIQKANDSHAKINVALLSWDMLPAALLLDNVNKLYVPWHDFCPQDERPLSAAHEEIMQQQRLEICKSLRNLLPQTDWISEYPKEQYLVLGSIKSSHDDWAWKHDLKKIENSTGGACRVTWDFLGLKKNIHPRNKLLATKKVAAILQLPRPRRQNEILFPALIDLEPESDTIRAAEIRDVSLLRPGEMDQEKALKLLYGPCAENERCDNFSRESIVANLSNLLPSEMFSRKKTELQAGEIRLRDCAQVLRCQLKREKICAASCNDIKNLPKTNAVRCYEVSLAARDPATGFVYPKRGAVVELGMEQLGANEKYLLRQNDVILAFRGTRETIGEVGIMARRLPDDGTQTINKVITGQSICIIRAYGETNPIWLYFYLRQPEVRQMLKDRAAGLSILNINLDALRELPVMPPSKYESEEINSWFGNLKRTMIRIEHQKEIAEDILKRISDVFREE